MRWSIILIVISTCLTGCAANSRAASAFFYLGSYTGASGIYGVSIDLTTGKLSTPAKLADTPGSSFLDYDRAHSRLFSIADAKDGAVDSFKADPVTRALTPINQAAAGGGGTTHISLSQDGRALLTANYNAGTVALVPITTAGELKGPAVVDKHVGKSTDPARQTAPHPHGIYFDPSGKFALCCDLGTDKMYVYEVDSAGAKMSLRSTLSMPPGSGPRHLTFSLGGHFAYVINELTSTVSVLKWDTAAAKLSMVQTLPLLPAGYSNWHRACEVAIHPSGQWLFAVDRGPDLVTTFKINPTTAKLTPVATTPTGGQETRHFAITPGGGFLVLANMNSDKLVAMKIDQKSGNLSPVSEVSVPKPACILFVP